MCPDRDGHRKISDGFRSTLTLGILRAGKRSARRHLRSSEKTFSLLARDGRCSLAVLQGVGPPSAGLYQLSVSGSVLGIFQVWHRTVE